MSSSGNADALFLALGGIIYALAVIISSVIVIAVVIAMLIALWKIFVKFGEPGWKCLIPGYGYWVLFEKLMVNNTMWFIFLWIPGLTVIAQIMSFIGLCKVFGKETGFIVLSIFFPYITMPILAFGPAQYNPELKI